MVYHRLYFVHVHAPPHLNYLQIHHQIIIYYTQINKIKREKERERNRYVHLDPRTLRTLACELPFVLRLCPFLFCPSHCFCFCFCFPQIERESEKMSIAPFDFFLSPRGCNFSFGGKRGLVAFTLAGIIMYCVWA